MVYWFLPKISATAEAGLDSGIQYGSAVYLNYHPLYPRENTCVLSNILPTRSNSHPALAFLVLNSQPTLAVLRLCISPEKVKEVVSSFLY